MNSIIDDVVVQNNKIFFERIDWDNYVFTTQFLKTKFKGHFYTRKADRKTVSEELIFREHLEDFQTIIYYFFFRHFPYIEYLLSIDFEILTDRTQGFVYLVDLYCIYETDPDSIHNEEGVREWIFKLIGDNEFSMQSPYLYLQSFLSSKDKIKLLFISAVPSEFADEY